MLLERLQMLHVEIKTGRLKEIRKARKIGRPVGITERQLAKIETSETAKMSTNEVSRLSHALQIPSMTLTGELPLTDSDLKPIYKSQCTSGCCS